MIFDGHSDLLCDVAAHRQRGERGILRRHADQFCMGGVEGAVLSIWVERAYQKEPAERTRQLMAYAEAELAECPEFRRVRTMEEAEAARQAGVLYGFMGAEGLAAIGRGLAGLDLYYEFGVRLAMLTWNEANALGAGAASGESGGLTGLGKQAVRRIQEMGMLLDVSHLNEAGFWDVARLTNGPFVASHSNARSLCGAARNLSDAQLRAIRDAGGVVGLNAYRGFLDEQPERQTVERLAEHAAHMIDVMGIDHVACGFDFCEFLEKEPEEIAAAEMEFNPVGMRNCTQIPNLFACLAHMGLSRAEQEKIARENFLRVLRQTVG